MNLKYYDYFPSIDEAKKMKTLSLSECTKEAIEAFKHVQWYHPTVTQVIYNDDAMWLYMDKDFNAFSFDNDINIDLIQSGIDSMDMELPCRIIN